MTVFNGLGISTPSPANRANRNRQWTTAGGRHTSPSTSIMRGNYDARSIALLKIEWLPSKIRSEVMSELGLSLQKQKSDVEEARTITLKFLVDECKAWMPKIESNREAEFMKPRWPKSQLGKT